MSLVLNALVVGAATAPAQAAPPPKRNVAVFGDRFGQALALGLAETDPALTVSPPASDDAGLTRQGFEEWLHALRDRLDRPDRPVAALMMVGSGDRGAVADGAGQAEPGTAAFQKAYAGRVDAVARLFRDAHVPLVWVGLPPVRSIEASADYVRLNTIVRDRAGPDGITYVDSWGAFTDEAGRYSPDGPDVDGHLAKLRRADGLGFTRAGARKLASFVEPDVDRLSGRTSASAGSPDLASLTLERARDFDAALRVDVNAQIRREAARDTRPGGAAIEQDVAKGPPAGPVLPLTAPPVAPGGQLATLPASPETVATVNVSSPKPGRADDFSWPRR